MSYNTVSMEPGISIAKTKQDLHDPLLKAHFAVQEVLWMGYIQAAPGGAISPRCSPASLLPWGQPQHWDSEPKSHPNMQI